MRYSLLCFLLLLQTTHAEQAASPSGESTPIAGSVQSESLFLPELGKKEVRVNYAVGQGQRLFVFPAYIVSDFFFEDKTNQKVEPVWKNDRLIIGDREIKMVVRITDLFRHPDYEKAVEEKLPPDLLKNKATVDFSPKWDLSILLATNDLSDEPIARGTYIKTGAELSYRLSLTESAKTQLNGKTASEIIFNISSYYKAKFNDDHLKLSLDILENTFKSCWQSLRTTANAKQPILFMPVGGNADAKQAFHDFFSKQVLIKIEQKKNVPFNVNLIDGLLDKITAKALTMIEAPGDLAARLKKDSIVTCALSNGIKFDIPVNKVNEISQKLDDFKKDYEKHDLQSLKDNLVGVDTSCNIGPFGGSAKVNVSSKEELKDLVESLHEATVNVGSAIKGDLTSLSPVNLSQVIENADTTTQSFNITISDYTNGEKEFSQLLSLGNSYYLTQYAKLEAMLNAAYVPKGTILAFWGDPKSLAGSKWKLCDGQNGTPDLIGKTIFGLADNGKPLIASPQPRTFNVTVQLKQGNQHSTKNRILMANSWADGTNLKIPNEGDFYELVQEHASGSAEIKVEKENIPRCETFYIMKMEE